MRTIIPLNYQWTFCQDWQSHYSDTRIVGKIVDIPHTVKLLPLNCFAESTYQGLFCYQKAINIEPSMADNKTILLNFEAVAHRAVVYCNGTEILQHCGGYTAFVADITHSVRVGENIITVMVDTTENADIPPFSGVIDYLCFGGIYREIQLVILDNQHIQRIMADADMYGNLHAKVTLFNDSPTTVSFRLLDKDGNISQEWVQSGVGIVETIIRVDNAQLWSCDSPCLYTLTATITSDSVSCRIGFRSCKFDKDGFVLNGQRIKLLGLNRHQSYAYVGYAMPKHLQQTDADIIKSSGCNIVRQSHYPQSRHFADRCDEIGLLCFVEAPGWQAIGQDKFRANYLQSVKEMIEEHYNHPSIILWGVRVNESRDCDQLYSQSNALARNIDSSRQTTGVRCFKQSHLLEDVYSYNDFVHTGDNRGISAKHTVCSARTPLLITEHNGHMYPTKPFDCISKRIDQARRHARVIDDMYGAKGVAGAIGWCLADYNTHIEFGSGDRICYHGITDMFRNNKPAQSIYASQQDNVPVLEIIACADMGDYDAMNRQGIMVASNCNYIKVYNNGNYVDTFYPNTKSYPHMPHAPFTIAHLLNGEVQRQYGYNDKDGKRILRALLAGVNGMQATDLLPALSVMLKFRKPMSYWQAMAMSVVMRNGQEDNYVFVGYIDDVPVIEKKFGQPKNYHLTLSTRTNSVVISDTYEIAQVDVAIVDNHDRYATYCDETLSIEVQGAIIIGDCHASVIGGQRSFFVRLDNAGEARVTVTSLSHGAQTLTLTATKQ